MHVLCLNFFKHTKVLRLEMTRGICIVKNSLVVGEWLQGENVRPARFIYVHWGGGGEEAEMYIIYPWTSLKLVIPIMLLLKIFCF